MRIMRDEECGGIMMIPLRCNVRDCRNKPNTIIGDDEHGIVYGLCEDHFQQGNQPGGCTFDLVFDGSDGITDAFEEATTNEA